MRLRWLKWIPWQYLARRAARANGFADPLALVSRFRQFGKPSEIQVPLELLRAGARFHARGLINTAAIQHNLDWVWPYWIVRQYEPRDEAFIPRAFSLTHVNLTHRNWTALGLPNLDLYPIVDPRGLLTPLWDGWSLDAWIVADDGRYLLPSRERSVSQHLSIDQRWGVVTECHSDGLRIDARADVVMESGRPVCRQVLQATSVVPAWFVLSLRPFNPEGVSFIDRVETLAGRSGWKINKRDEVILAEPADELRASNYRDGDVYMHLTGGEETQTAACEVGMATAAALYRLAPDSPRLLEARIPLTPRDSRRGLSATAARPVNASGGNNHAGASLRGVSSWEQALAGHARLTIPDQWLQFLYDAALRTLILHTPGEVYPGPYTYRRFWIRDTAFVVNSLLCAGLASRAEHVLPHLLVRQTRSGYFLSQDGEWDANGEALWTFGQWCRLSGHGARPEWRDALVSGAEWIARKRLPRTPDSPHAGLLPAGFSAEHLGANDHYYWDDFWAVGGLQAAAALLDELGDSAADRCRREAADLFRCIERSLAQTRLDNGRPVMPAAPDRRMDTGAIGSLAAGYPLALVSPDDRRLMNTVAVLRGRFFVDGGFFQDMIHSGINAYLTLHIAQVMLRAGDPQWFDLMQTVAGLASPTGQWPEAIHPRTRGGCMGDGHHVWAAAEWVMALRNAIVREEGDRLLLASGITPEWLADGQVVEFGPAPTAWGNVAVRAVRESQRLRVERRADWRGEPPVVEVRPMGFSGALIEATKQ